MLVPVKLFCCSSSGDRWKYNMTKRKEENKGLVAAAFIVARPDTQQVTCVSPRNRQEYTIMSPGYDLGLVSIVKVKKHAKQFDFFYRQAAHPKRRRINMELDQ
jgi:hypothetical protein